MALDCQGNLAGLSRLRKTSANAVLCPDTPAATHQKGTLAGARGISALPGKFPRFPQPTPLSPSKGAILECLGSRHSAVGGGGGPRCNARAGLLAVRTVDRALTSSWDDGLWRGLPRKWRGHLVRLPRAFTALTLHHQVDRELAKYEARRLLYVNGLRSARR